MPQEFKDYVLFPQGSYWIYEDSITNKIDSIFLLKNYMSIIDDDRIYCICKYETVSQLFYSSILNDNFSRFIEPFWGDFENKYAYYLNPMMSGHIFIFPQSSYGDFFKYKHINFMNVNNTVYENVHAFEKKMLKEGYMLTNYFVKQIGIIKRKIITTDNDTIVWELKEYHINN